MMLDYDVDFVIKQGDREPYIETTLRDQHGNPINLGGGRTVRFRMWPYGYGDVVVDAPADIIAQAGGRARYAWQEGDTDSPGLFEAEWLVTNLDGSVETYPNGGHNVIQVVRRRGG